MATLSKMLGMTKLPQIGDLSLSRAAGGGPLLRPLTPEEEEEERRKQEKKPKPVITPNILGNPWEGIY
jgi:hypothetical protein